MIFVYAFLFPALFAVIAQAVLEKTKVPVPVLLKGSVILGAVLAFFGVMDKLNGLAGFGMITHITALGEAVYSGVLAALKGDPAAITVLLGIIVTVLAASGLFGLIVKPKK